MHLLRLHRGTVRALTRRRAIWRGPADPPETSFSIDGVRLVFPRGPEGPNELQTIYEGMPKILRVVLSETEIREAMQNIDSDIEDLLGDAE